MTDLEQHIQTIKLIDTHEHMHSEAKYVNDGPDILQDLFNNYVISDLVSAGASDAAIKRLEDKSDPDVAGRFAAVQAAWERCKFTGYGEAVTWVARNIYGIEELNPSALEKHAPRALAFHKPGERLRVLRDVAGLDHVQIDNFVLGVAPDSGGADFFLYDISWAGFCSGELNAEDLHSETGIAVRDVRSLREAFDAAFAQYAPCAIAVKSQHAYERTLQWRRRTDDEVAPIVARLLRQEAIRADERLCFGDWCLARGAELAAQHNLPFKIHTGYATGNNYMHLSSMSALLLDDLLMEYPQTQFVLMHISYPFAGEVAALAKHFPNAFVDLCWAWSIDPHTSTDFVRRMIHAVPSNKLFAFGGDTFWPHSAAAFAAQARAGMARALQAEVSAGAIRASDALGLATRFMQSNQREVFDIDGRRRAIAAKAN